MTSRHELPAGTQLDGKYIIERVIGAGGFGITYAAHDIGLNTTVALKEYYPADFGTRDHTMSVRPKNDEDRDLFERLRQSFVREARTLAQFKHPAIVRVLSVFESHGTAYMVMEYEEGKSLKSWLQNLGRLPSQAELDRIVPALLDAVDVLHQANFLHRDIAPDNIILRPNGSPVLLDFGAARRVMTEATSNLTGIIKQGYSPQEQHASDGKLQGPWTDIYALGATLYHAVTGAPPVEAMTRMLEDNLLPAVHAAAGNYRHGFLAGIDAALQIRPKDRPQSIPEFKELLLGDGVRKRDEDAWHRQRTHLLPGGTDQVRTGVASTSTAPLGVLGLVSAPRTDALPGSPTTSPASQRTATGPVNVHPRASMIGAVLVGGMLLTGLAGAVKLATRPSGETVVINTTPPIVQPPVVQPPVTPPAKSDPLDKQRDAILEEAKRRAEQAERERLARDKQATTPPVQTPPPQTVPLTPPRIDQAEIDRRRIEQAKRNQADSAYQEAVNFANGTGGVTRDYNRARPLFERSAAAGNPDAMNWLGWLYFHGRGVTQDYPKAREWYEKAAAAGHATAMNQLGWFYQNGLGVPTDFPRSIEWYQRAANAGSAVAMFNLGSAYQNGRGTPVDLTRAREWYEIAAAQGDASAMSQLGWLLQNGLGVPVDYVKAREWYEKAANAGNATGMNQLGWLYQNGLGLPRDFAKAREWYEKGAAAGSNSSMNQLGWLYANGQGVPKDFAKAREWYEKAANAGSAIGMYNLANAYENGQGVPRDYVRAREWYEKAAAAGDSASMSQIGWLFQNGFGLAVDYGKAREWYEKAAAAGNGTAMNQLGWLHQNALGVPQNYQIAREWYEKAAAAGNGSGMNQLGWFYANGLGVPKDAAKAREWYERAAAAGKDTGIWNLAIQLDNGVGGSPNYVRAAQLLLRGVRNQHDITLKDLGGDMANWNAQTRIELKRELQKLGHYQGAIDAVWNDAARSAINEVRRRAAIGG
ncbi:MAG: protein kinase domain-containing protein [Hyphomicrobiaceae bacterium]